MIIKSKTRKDASFRQLVNYIMRETGGVGVGEEQEKLFTLIHNFADDIMPDDMEGITRGFLENAKLLKQRKNGVMLYHEIASFAPEDTQKVDRSILEELCRKYIQVRASRGMVLARPHFDKDHLHIHFLISGNERDSDRRLRVDKETFQKQRREIETYQLERFPQLNRSYVHSRDRLHYMHQRKNSPTHPTRMMEERGAKQTVKQQLTEKVTRLIGGVNSMKELKSMLNAFEVQTYERGGVINGIVHNNRKYRFSTLLKGTDHVQRLELLLASERELARAREQLKKLLLHGPDLDVRRER